MTKLKFKTKREQAHYICTALAEPLAELILDVKSKMLEGGYVRKSDYRYPKEGGA